MTRAGSGKRLAGTGVAVTLTGVKAIDRRLKKLAPAIQKKVLTQAMRAGMKIIQAQVKANARAAFMGGTGATVKGVKVRAVKRSRKRFGIDVRINKGAYVGETFYSAFLEYGTAKMKPRPFMEPAFRAKGKTARDETIRKALEGVEREVRNLAKGG